MKIDFLHSLLLLVLASGSNFSDETHMETEDSESDALGWARKAYNQLYSQGLFASAFVEMITTDRSGRIRFRRYSLARIQQEPDLFSQQRYFIYFHEPRDVEGMSFLVWRNPDAVDHRWLYLPATQVVRKISARDARTTFFGSCFFYEDITGRSTNEDRFELKKLGEDQVVLSATPINGSLVEFDQYYMTIDVSTYLPIRIDYFRSGKPIRIFEIREIRTIEGRATPVEVVMTDMKQNRSTVMRYYDLTYEGGFSWDVFTERILRHPPRDLISR